MSPTDVKPSPRLVRAAEAEREDLRRQRAKLADSREQVLAHLREIERAMAEIDEREMLLAQLVLTPLAAGAGPPSGSLAHGTTSASLGDVDLAVDADGPQSAGGSGLPAHEVLRGPAIRETAVRLLVRRGDIEALHYREWFELLQREGYAVAGKDGLAVFLTQISRSPAVRKGTQAGVYELDRHAPQRLAREFARLQGELRELTGRTPGTTDLSEVRARREQLTSAIGQAERALEEAQRVLTLVMDDVDPGAPVAVAGTGANGLRAGVPAARCGRAGG